MCWPTPPADGVSIEANGLAAVTMQGVTVRLAPSVAYLNHLADDVAAALPGATLRVNEDGTYLATAGDARYALRPDWFSHIDVSRAAGFVAAADGRLGYLRNFRAFTMHPAFADYVTLAAAVADALPGATATANADGTASIVSGERRWTLTPLMQLEVAPTGNTAWWVDGTGRSWLKHGDDAMQEFRFE